MIERVRSQAAGDFALGLRLLALKRACDFHDVSAGTVLPAEHGDELNEARRAFLRS